MFAIRDRGLEEWKEEGALRAGLLPGRAELSDKRGMARTRVSWRRRVYMMGQLMIAGPWCVIEKSGYGFLEVQGGEDVCSVGLSNSAKFGLQECPTVRSPVCRNAQRCEVQAAEMCNSAEFSLLLQTFQRESRCLKIYTREPRVMRPLEVAHVHRRRDRPR